MGVFVLLRAAGCVGWHLGGTEAGRADVGMPREGLWLGWKECPCSLLQWEGAPELPET